MKTLFKNCDIVTTTDSGFEVIRNGFCGVDGAYICYLGTDMPAEKYDTVKDMTGRVLYPGLINAHNHAAMTALAATCLLRSGFTTICSPPKISSGQRT